MADEDGDTPAALLTKRQREYLRGDASDLAESTERGLRTRIRDRVHALVQTDLQLLATTDADLGAEYLVSRVDDDSAFARGLRSQVALAYRLARAADLDADEIVREGVKEGERGHAAVLLERLREDPESLTVGELRDLQLAGADLSEIDELLGDTVRPPIGNVGEQENLQFFERDGLDDDGE